MSDFSQTADAPDADGLNAAPVSAESLLSAGGLIRQAREASGLHIAALAVALKVPVKKLEALEQDRFDLLPDAVFVRALASSVCRTLKIDPALVLGRLPQTAAPKLIYQGTGINEPFRAPGDGPRPSIWTQVSRPAVLAGLAFLLGALVLIFLPAARQEGLVDKVVAAASTSGAAQPAAPATPVTSATSVGMAGSADEGVKLGTGAGQVLEASNAPNASTAAAVPNNPLPAMLSSGVMSGGASFVAPTTGSTASAASTQAEAPMSALSRAAPAAVTTANTASSVQAAVPSSGLLTLRAKGESWVEVVDAKGVVVVRRILAAGEVVGVSGALPLTAVIGRADATQVLVRGQALDLAPIARDNVARFEVK